MYGLRLFHNGSSYKGRVVETFTRNDDFLVD